MFCEVNSGIFKVDIDTCEPNKISCTSPYLFLEKEWIQVPHYVGITPTPASAISRRCRQVHGYFLQVGEFSLLLIIIHVGLVLCP